jgi:hypothetical protein
MPIRDGLPAIPARNVSMHTSPSLLLLIGIHVAASYLNRQSSFSSKELVFSRLQLEFIISELHSSVLNTEGLPSTLSILEKHIFHLLADATLSKQTCKSKRTARTEAPIEYHANITHFPQALLNWRPLFPSIQMKCHVARADEAAMLFEECRRGDIMQ